MIKTIAEVSRPDGLVFDMSSFTAEVIREEDEYSGVRISLRCTLGPARIHFHVDINVGDPIWPAPRTITLPRLLGGSVEISGYPLAMIFAEKTVTAIQRAQNNTRWRDFADILLLSAYHTIDGGELHRAITEVAVFRNAELAPLNELLDGSAAIGQLRWVAWRTKQRICDRLPEEFDTVLKTIAVIADPAITGDVKNKMWNPLEHAWR